MIYLRRGGIGRGRQLIKNCWKFEVRTSFFKIIAVYVAPNIHPLIDEVDSLCNQFVRWDLRCKVTNLPRWNHLHHQPDQALWNKWSGIKKEESEKPNQMPLVPCIPPDSEAAGYATVSNARAVAAGMTFRSVADSSHDSLKWIKEGQDPKRTAQMQKFLDSGNENDLLKAWGDRER